MPTTRKRWLIASLLLAVLAGGGWYWRTSSSGCCRLEIQRSFHRGIVFEIHRPGLQLELEAKFFAGAYNIFGPAVQTTRHTLTPEEQSELTRLLAQTREPLTSRLHGMLMDGSSWNFRAGGPLAAVQSWRSPTYYGPDPIRDLGLFLWRIAKVDEPEKELY